MFKAKKKSRKKELADLLASGEVMPASELAKVRHAKTLLLQEFKDAVMDQQSLNKSKRPAGIGQIHQGEAIPPNKCE